MKTAVVLPKNIRLPPSFLQSLYVFDLHKLLTIPKVLLTVFGLSIAASTTPVSSVHFCIHHQGKGQQHSEFILDIMANSCQEINWNPKTIFSQLFHLVSSPFGHFSHYLWISFRKHYLTWKHAYESNVYGQKVYMPYMMLLLNSWITNIFCKILISFKMPINNSDFFSY